MNNQPAMTPTVTPPTAEQDSGLLVRLEAHESALEVVSESNEGSPDSIMEVEGVALKDDIISANLRYYSAEFNDKLIENTNRYIDEGGIATMFTSHGKAAGTGGLFTPVVEELPIGRIVKLFRAKDAEEIVKYQAIIMPTSEGRDVQVLLRHGGIGSTSIRADGRTVTCRMGRVDGQDVEIMENATLSGIDFTAHPGVAGAGIVRVFESAPQVAYSQETETKEEDMLEDATLDQLKEKCPELIEELTGELTTAHTSEVDELNNQLASLTQALEASANPEESARLNEELEAAQAEILELQIKLAVAEAAHVGISSLVAEKIRAGDPKTAAAVQDLAHEAIKEALDEALAASLGTASERGSVQGDTHPPDRAKVKSSRSAKMTEEHKDMIRLSGGRLA